jgi:hypothetical protein
MILNRNATLLFAAIVAAGALKLGTSWAAEVGVTAAVNPRALGTPPGEPTRNLIVGSDVFFNERIVTEGEGQTQILFLDQSSMTIGPGSDILLDAFVYDPDTSTGEMAVSVTTGVLRYIGGKIAKDEDVVFKTRHATIGIRGSSLVLQSGDDETKSLRTSGRMFCEKNGETLVVTVDDKVCSCDATACEIEDVDPDWLKRVIASLTGDKEKPGDMPVKKVNTVCGADAPVKGGRCGDDVVVIPTPKEFEDMADLDEFIQQEQVNDLKPIDMDEPDEPCQGDLCDGPIIDLQ